ncbi:MAG: tyrosine-type recombinase/integrase, partial [bacterium]|nr:tyrosine-type recombinase/integrase [bacterium]
MTNPPDETRIIPALWGLNYDLLMPKDPNKDEKSRIGYFVEWLSLTGRVWYTPDLPAYLHYLLHERIKTNLNTGDITPAPLSPTTANVHLATIRGRYHHLLKSNVLRDLLYAQATHLESLADRKAFVDEVLVRIQNDIHPTSATATVITKMDTADSEHLRLRPSQVRALLRLPGVNTLIGVRDTAMIAILACTGIREAELVALQVDDLRQVLGGEVALRVREGKNHKQRLVP